MSFSFDFLADNASLKGETAEESRQQGDVPLELEGATIVTRQPSEATFRWIQDVPHLLTSLSTQGDGQLVFDEILLSSKNQQKNDEGAAIAAPARNRLRYVDAENSSTSSVNPLPAHHNHNPRSDLVPGVYEGGLKIWECSLDLVRYLHQYDIRLQPGQSALELGCGHALPSCYLLRQHFLLSTAHKHQHKDHSTAPPISLVLSDYNDYVLQGVTLSNLLLNTADLFPNNNDDDDDDDNNPAAAHVAAVSQIVRLAAGDWLSLSQQLAVSSKTTKTTANNDAPSEQEAAEAEEEEEVEHYQTFDLICAAETLYSESAARETCLLLQRHLKPQTGRAYVATKRHYFGVGGGVLAFCDAARALAAAAQRGRGGGSRQLRIATLAVHDNGSGNIRELLEVQSVRTTSATT